MSSGRSMTENEKMGVYVVLIVLAVLGAQASGWTVERAVGAVTGWSGWSTAAQKVQELRCTVRCEDADRAEVVAPLSQVPIAPESAATKYQRTYFGSDWTDGSLRNGCDTRNDALGRDLRKVSRWNRCKVATGVLVDPYTGQTHQFTSAKADAVQVDHIVALAEAWRSGASTWSTARRVAFANDLAAVTSTYGPVNNAKGDQDAKTWRPPTEPGQCFYARQVVAIKLKYSLSVDQGERDALVQMLTRCP